MNAHVSPDSVSADTEETWTVAGRTFRSRLIVGTGKYKDFAQNAAALEASGAEIVTVAVRRVNVSDPKAPMLTDFIDPKKYTYLPNTAGCFTADDAIRGCVIGAPPSAAAGRMGTRYLAADTPMDEVLRTSPAQWVLFVDAGTEFHVFGLDRLLVELARSDAAVRALYADE